MARDSDRKATGIFVGRASERVRLRAALAAAISGDGRLVLVVGEPGIGKTRLVEEIAAEAEAEGARVLIGRCHEGDGAPAYWPWVGVLRRLATLGGGAAMQRWLGAGAGVVAAIVPEVGGGAASSEHLDGEAARFRFFDAVVSTLARAAGEAPLVIVLDDLHAADGDSLHLLTFAVRELADARVLVLATARTVEMRTHVAAPARELLSRSAEYLDLDGLSATEVAALMAALLAAEPPVALATRIHDATHGNPFFVESLVRAAVPSETTAASLTRLTDLPLPDGVRDAVHARLRVLSDHARELLVVAALLGRECRPLVLAQAAGVTLATATAALAEAEHAGLVGPLLENDRHRFVHGLIPETLVADLGVTERARAHRRIADALAPLVSSGGATLDEVAAHYFAALPAGAAAEAVASAIAAARHAVSRLGYDDAVRHLRRALQAYDTLPASDPARGIELLLHLGDAERRVGDMAAAQETFRRAVRLATEAKLPTARARAALGFGAGLGGFWDQSVGIVDLERVAMLRDALDALGPAPSGLRAQLLAQLSAALFWSASPERSNIVPELGRDAIAVATATGDALAALEVLAVAHWTSWGPDDPARRLRAAEDIIRRATELEQPDLLLRGRMYAATHHLELGDAAAAEQEIGRYEAHAAQWGLQRQLWYVQVYRGMRAHLRGGFDEVERAADAGLALGAKAQPLGARFAFAAQRALVRREQGRAGETIETLRELVTGAPGMPVWACALVVALIEQGEYEAARRELDRLAAKDFAVLPRNFLWLYSMAQLARACAALGDRVRAAVVYEQMAPYGGQIVVAQHGVLCDGAVDRYLGILAATLERCDDASRHLERALVLNRQIDAPIFVTAAQWDLAAVLRRRGGHGDGPRADALVAEAADGARALGQAALLAKIHETGALGTSGVVASPATPPAPAEDVCELRRAGTDWSVVHGGRAFAVEDRIGMGYLVTLLRHPGQEVHALDLVAGEGPKRVGGDAGAMLDERARAGYRTRLAELAGELDEACEFHDDGRAARAQAEMDALTDELARAVGLGGRARRAGSDVDRARLNVTRAVRRAIAALAAEDAALGHDLTRGVRTGIFCSYSPDPRLPVRWEV